MQPFIGLKFFNFKKINFPGCYVVFLSGFKNSTAIFKRIIECLLLNAVFETETEETLKL